MADTYEKDLAQKASLTTSDFIRVVGSDNVSYKQGVANVLSSLKLPFTWVANGGDFDTFTPNATLGYALYRGDQISSMSNKPSAETNTFPWALEVMNVSGYVKQILHVYTSTGAINTYERIQFYSNGSRPFGAWEKHPTRAEIDALKLQRVQISVTGNSTLWTNKYYQDVNVSSYIPSGKKLLAVTLGSATNGGVLSAWINSETTVRLMNNTDFTGITQVVYLLIG